MKTNTHPHWNDATVTCACGNTFTTGSILENITVDICSKCHPFFTNEMRFVDRQGRVDRFRQKMAAAASGPTGKKAKKQKAAGEVQSFKDILKQQRTAIKAE